MKIHPIILLFISNDEIISPTISARLFCVQFLLKNLSIAGLWKDFLAKNGRKRSRPNVGVIVLPLLSLFFCKIGLAQQHNFSNYSVTEGLAQSQVSTILEDQKGYLWLGTRGGGLCQFDGANFTTFTTQNGLSSNYINTIFEDAKGVLWVATTNGLNQLIDGKVVNLDTVFTKKIIVNDLLEDENGIIWLAANEGLFYMDNQQLKPFVEHAVIPENQPILTLFEDANQTLWVGAKKGLYKIKNQQVSEIRLSNGAAINDVRGLTATKDGVLWIAAYNQGVLLADEERVLRKLDASTGLTSTKIQTIAIDNRENIWLGSTDKGVSIWQANNRNFINLTSRQGLPNNNVQSIVDDSWGNIWLGTSGGGLSKYSGQQFEHFTTSEGLKGNYIQAIENDSKGRIWVATSGNGVQMYDAGKFSNFGANSDLFNTTCKAIFEDNLGHTWFGTVDKGLTVFLDSLFLTFTEDNGLSGNFITAIDQDTLGQIWAISENSGVTKIAWNEANPSQSVLTKFTTQNGLPTNRINDLHIDQQNRIWLATDGGGIVLIEEEKVQTILTKNEGLAENVVRSLREDSLGYLWYGTASFGVGNIRLYEGDFLVNNNYKGLISNNIKLLEVDASNNLWIGSEKGVNVLKLDAARNVLSKEYYGQLDGFRGVETNKNTVLKDAENNLWFGTVNGLTKFNATVQKGKDYPPKIYLKSAKLLDQDIEETPYVDKLENWTNLKLTHDENDLSFTVEAMHLSYPQNLQYEWQIKGGKKGWSTASFNNTYQRIFLPGQYELMVRAKTARGNNYSETLTFPFEIATPFWQNLWFRLGALLTGLLLIGLFVKWRINLVKKRAKRIQDRLVLDKKLLELEQKALQLQMNPHFIFNALNSIQGSITPDNIKVARLQLAKFSKLMRATLENAREDAIPLEEEITTLTNYLSLEQFSQGNTFDYELIVDESLDPEAISLPSMILQPFVENAIIHGVAHLENRGKILVHFSRKGKRLSCVIEDNGIGRAKAKELKSQIDQSHKSVALEITKERLDLLRTGKAVKNSLQIIDLKDAAGKACGTRVELIIPIEEE